MLTGRFGRLKDQKALAVRGGNAINLLDESLKTLNVGIVHWHKFAGDERENGRYWAQYIGYAKVGPKWGLALIKISGNYEAPPEYQRE